EESRITTGDSGFFDQALEPPWRIDRYFTNPYVRAFPHRRKASPAQTVIAFAFENQALRRKPNALKYEGSGP
ncbi:MAG: hypothetical protein ACPGOV_14510, partial [Magnetovibrionaceae bacterium]